MRSLAVVFAGVLLLPSAAWSQISAGGTPPSLDRELGAHLDAEIPIEVMPVIDVDALRAEDRERDLDTSLPWRFGYDIEVDLGFERGGSWESLPDGSRLWRLGITSQGAVSLNLAFDRFVLPPGARLFVRSADGAQVIGAFTETNNKHDGRFATTLVESNTIVLEYLEPAHPEFGGELHLARVTHGYRSVKSTSETALGESGACQNNVNCPPLTTGWEDASRSVAKYVMGGSLCTGALINNTANDGTPYFLTADHCYSNPSYWVFWFNYEASGCSDPSWDPPYDSVSGATFRASNSNSDFVLVELSSAPPPSYDVFYAGWSRSSSAPSSAACIHHPGGDIKKFSWESGQIGPSGNFWDVGPWDDGTTEGGSSGSPLFDSNHRIVGQLYGGSSACWGASENSGTDIYGRLDVSWSGSSSSSRLSDWLDPLGTSSTAIDGHDPNAPTWDVDAAVSIVEPSDGSVACSSPVSAQVQLSNQGATTLTAADIDYRLDGGAWNTWSWTGSLAPSSSTIIALPDLAVAGGNHDFEVEVDAAGSDGNATNDSASSDFSVQGGAGTAAPLSQGFESGAFPPSGWSLVNPDGAEEWIRTASAGGFGGSSSAAFFDNFEDDYRGEVDSLRTPFIDLTTVSSPTLQFDVAYARYDAEYSDTLEVRISDDCGASWDVAYERSGTSLATASDHSDPFVPTSAEWRTETVSLSAWAGESSVLIAFDDVTGYGNNLFVDDVLIAGASGGDDDDSWGDDDDDAGDDDDDAGDDDDDTPVESNDDDDPGSDDDDDDDEDASDDDDAPAAIEDGDSKAAYVDKLEPYCGCDSGGSGSGAGVGLTLFVIGAGIASRRRRISLR